MLWESFCFGMKVATALFHAGGMDWVLQAVHISLHKSFRAWDSSYTPYTARHLVQVQKQLSLVQLHA